MGDQECPHLFERFLIIQSVNQADDVRLAYLAAKLLIGLHLSGVVHNLRRYSLGGHVRGNGDLLSLCRDLQRQGERVATTKELQ